MAKEQENKSVHLTLEVISPDRKVVSAGEIDQVLMPGSAGDMTILPDHFPLVSHLTAGIVEYAANDELHHCFVSGGIVEVKDDTVTILSPAAEKANEIDMERARKALSRAEQKALDSDDPNRVKQAQAALERSRIRLELAELVKKHEESE